MQPPFLRHPIKAQNKLKTQIKINIKKILKNIKMQPLSVYLDITKITDFRWKDADVSRTQGVCQVIYIFFGSSLGKV